MKMSSNVDGLSYSGEGCTIGKPGRPSKELIFREKIYLSDC